MPAFESLAYFHKICPVETLVATQSIQNGALLLLESLALGGLRGIQSSHALELPDNSSWSSSEYSLNILKHMHYTCIYTYMLP